MTENKKVYHPIIKDLILSYHELYEVEYYFTEDMIKNNFYIMVEHPELEDENGYAISISHLSQNDSEVFTIYNGSYLEPIQIYHIIKDIKEIYDNNTITDVIDMLKGISCSYMSSSMQGKAEHSYDIRRRIEDKMYELKACI